ncbi:MAG TPA: multicopper oxidase family protein [Candidatus Baltobacteraceae bacterium]|nr:multicopper oxidase family protein [Candidatus Baltobacteraceae bacterium]
MPAAPPRAAICGSPMPAGSLARPPEIEVSSLPLDDRGLHELILRVAQDKERFCYLYTFQGRAQNAAPVLRMRSGERFALRIVNEIQGPASGATLAASAIPPCSPAPMKMEEPRAFAGYLGHTFYARNAVMKATDVNIHLHGFQGPASEENVFLSTLSTPEHACEYDITVPKTQPPGTYFYHPHAHGMSDDLVAGGLSGMWIVESASPQIARSDDHAVIIKYRVPFVEDDRYMPDTALMGPFATMHEAALKSAPVMAYDPFNPPPWPTPFPVRFGDEFLNKDRCGNFDSPEVSVNGVDAPATLTVPAGQTQLLRVLNATSDSFKYLRMRDASGKVLSMQIAGRDGIPFSGNAAQPYAKYLALSGVRLVPTGRLDLLLTLKAGESVTLYSDHDCLGMVGEYALKHDLLTVTAGAQPASPTVVASTQLTPVQSPAVELLRYARAHASSIRKRAFTYTQYPVPNSGKPGGHPEFYITETSNVHFTERPFWPMYANGAKVPQPDVVVHRGTIEEWYLFNASLEPHTFHIHQMAFVAEDEQPQPVMLDTVLVPTGSILPNKADPNYPLIKPGLTKVLLDFRNVPRGTFVFHCHMLFHEDRGMMGIIKVI